MKVEQKKFDVLDGKEITSYRIMNDNGVEATAINYGCIITNICAPDKHGKIESIALGFDTIKEYTDRPWYFGPIIGRFAGRIKKGKFTLDGRDYELATNHIGNHLHGGNVGFDKVFWDAKIIENNSEVGVLFEYFSPDGEEGYPGNVKVKVKYTLNNHNEFKLDYEGVPDQRTLINITNHTYFNLSGNLKHDILEHELTIKSDKFLEIDETLAPTGQMLPVDNTVFDFRKGRRFTDQVASPEPQNMAAGNGYDHLFVLSENENKEIILKEEISGRVVTIETDQPGTVLYTGTQLTDDFTLRGVQSRKYMGIVLETQGFPDSINRPNFPSCIVEKDEVYQASTKWTFSCDE